MNIIFLRIQSQQLQIKQLQASIEKNDVEGFKTTVGSGRHLAFYRDAQGKSSLHQAIEKKNFEIALHVVQQYPHLAKLNDCV